MAKGNLFLGHAKGKVGSVVFSRLKGQQISKAYNPNPSNPKTRAQALQRAQFSTVVAASVALKEVINNSFDGVKNGQDSVNEFVSRNVLDIRARGLAGDFTANEWLVPKGQSFMQPQPWILSKGVLGFINPPDLYNLVKEFSCVGQTEFTDDMAYGVQAKTLNSIWRYKPGCQLTFVTVTLEVNPQTNQYTLRPRYDRVIFNDIAPGENSTECPILYELDDQEKSAFIPASYLDMTKTTLSADDNRVYLPKYLTISQENTGNESLPTIKLGIAITDDFGNMVEGLGVICTQLDNNGNYIHSDSVFAYNADGYDYTVDAVATYMASTVAKIRSSDYYTEQASDGSDDNSNLTLPEVVSAVISGRGMTEKGVYLEQSNSYGPVAEGTPVTLQLTTAYPFQITNNSVKAYNGETPLGNDWTILRASSRSYVITGPMPTTASFPFNVSFDVYDPSDGSNLGRAALRINVSKANS